MSADEKLARLGQLMSECQDSCRDLFECSCEEMDLLVRKGLDAKAYGVQLCGAGWGGCAIALVPQTISDQFMKDLKETYYDIDEHRRNNFSTQALFVTSPNHGASVQVIQVQ